MYRYVSGLFFGIAIFIAPFVANSQVTVSGKVFDEIHNQPINGVNIRGFPPDKMKGGKKKATQNGFFSFEANAYLDSLTLEKAGYFRETIPLPQNRGQLRNLQIGMTPRSVRAFEEVVISGYDEGETTNNVPGNIAIVDQANIEATSDHTIARTLDQVPGLHYQQGAYSTGRMTIRGIGSRSPYSTTKIKAYYHEIPISTGEGVTNLMDLTPNTLARTEVIKGPISSVYGAGLGGAILLEPKRGLRQGTQVKAGGGGGSHGYWTSQASLQHVGDDQRVKANYTRTHMDGFRENSEFDRHNATFSGSFYAGEGSTINVFGTFILLKSYIPSSLSRQAFENNPSMADEGWKNARGHEKYDKTIFGASYETQLASNLESTTALFTNYKNNDEPRPFNILQNERFSYGVRHLTTFSPEFFSMRSSFTLGGEFYNEWYQRQTFENLGQQLGGMLSNTEQNRQYGNIFLSADIQVSSRFSLSGGMNYNQTNYDLKDLLIPDTVNPGTQAYQRADQSGTYQFEPIWSPRIGLNYEWRKSHNVYASVSSGFSQPSVQETLGPEGALNPDIKPESGTSYEIGGKGYWKSLRLRYNLSLYHMQVKDKLVARRVDRDRYIGLNAGSTVHNGAELSIESKDWLDKQQGWLSGLSPFIRYAYQDFRFEEFVAENPNGKLDYSGNELTGTAPHHLTAGFKTKLWASPGTNEQNQFRLRFYYRFRDEMPVLDDNSVYTKAYHIFNGRLSYTHHFNGLMLESFVSVRNFTDDLYAAMVVPNAPGYGGAPRYYYPGEPRALRFGLTANIDLAE